MKVTQQQSETNVKMLKAVSDTYAMEQTGGKFFRSVDSNGKYWMIKKSKFDTDN